MASINKEIPADALTFRGQPSPAYNIELLHDDIARLISIIKRCKNGCGNINTHNQQQEPVRD